jgi:uroporphyrinogen-III synthase
MRRLVILRPEPGASASVERARGMGLDAVAVPLFEVEPVAWDAPETRSFDALLLTSANAVRCAGQALQQLRGLKVHAIGRATADAAREAGFDIATIGTADADRLLGSIEPGQRLLHLTEEHRAGADDAGHEITRIVVYRSRAVEQPDGLEQAQGAVVALHSPRAGARFAELADATELDRASIKLVAISEAAAEAAGNGWEAVEVAERPDDSTLLALAGKLCDKPRP